MKQKTYLLIIGVIIIAAVYALWLYPDKKPATIKKNSSDTLNSKAVEKFWTPPDTSQIPNDEMGELIRYGRKLIVHTSVYLGPRGKIQQISNGMNCDNCHINAGTEFWGNNFSRVASSYPEYRSRSGQYVSIAGRVNGCMERSLNGKPLDTTSHEMMAIVAYLKWIGKNVTPKEQVSGTGIQRLPYLQRPADPERGRIVFMAKCEICHRKNGEGKFNDDSTEYLYPPLWGKNSYNIGAGMYRISTFAGYVKNNMPFGATYHNSQLSIEEAWDVAAFVNSQPRPYKDLHNDWPAIASKPFDYPFGPYADQYSEKEHKYGPYPAMLEKTSGN